MASPSPKSAPLQLSIPLPLGFDTRIYIHLTIQTRYTLLFLTTASSETAPSTQPVGSFVYSLPDRSTPERPLLIPLVYEEETLDFASQLARLLARKTQLPVYVGNSVSFANTVLGGSVEEQVAALRKVHGVVVDRLQSSSTGAKEFV